MLKRNLSDLLYCARILAQVLTSFSTLLALESLETAQLPLLDASPSRRCRLLREFLQFKRLEIWTDNTVKGCIILRNINPLQRANLVL